MKKGGRRQAKKLAGARQTISIKSGNRPAAAAAAAAAARPSDARRCPVGTGNVRV